jgi:hypothetical protein
VAQYEQLHEMRREYNRFIYQAPSLVVVLVGGLIAVVVTTSKGNNVNFFRLESLRTWWPLLFLAGAFSGVIGYWSYRSQILLRRCEATLQDMEQKYGDRKFCVYPFEVNATLGKRYQKMSSTRGIVIYLLALSLILIVAGTVGAAWPI